MGNILFSFAVTGQALRWFSLQTRNDILLAIAIVVAWLPCLPTATVWPGSLC
jgi:hypothetical protein